MRPPRQSQVRTCQAGQLGGCAPQPAGGLECTASPPCSEAGPLVGGQGRHEGRGIVQISKPSPGASSPPIRPTLSQAAAAGVADAVVSSAEASGRPPEGPPGGSGGQWGRWQLPPSQGWLPWPSRPPGPPGLGAGVVASEFRRVPPAFSPPTAHQAPWLRPPPVPGCVCRAPWGRQGRRHSRLGTAGARAAKYLLELSETDRHVGNLVHVGLGEAAGWAGRQAGGRWEAGAASPAGGAPRRPPFPRSGPKAYPARSLSSCSRPARGVGP